MKIFWSWQSDHDSKVSHYLVRDALQIAIDKLKLPREIEEPSEAERRANLELDHDTKNETGWTDIADAIFKKIELSAVFIADVTPVATSPSKLKDGKEVGLRPVMNPNVAIELGFALKARAWSNCIGVLNLAYGTVDGLPFDINRNRSWPVTYSLLENASKADIDAARKKLAEEFYLRLRPFLTKIPGPVVEEFPKTVAVRPPAFWFEKGQSLGTRRDGEQFTMPFEKVLFARLIPTDSSQHLISHELAGHAASRYGSFAVSGNLFILRNDDGAAMCEFAGATKNIDSIAQYFNNGEIWGVNADIVRLGENGNYQYLLMNHVEEVFRKKLSWFIDCMTKEFGVTLPIKLICGVSGVKGRLIAWSGVSANGYSKMIKDSVELERNLNSTDQSAIDQYLLELFEKIFEASGKPRPKNFGGFPG